MNYDFTIESNARDCDGPMHRKPIERINASRDEMEHELGEFCLQFQTIRKEFNESGSCTFYGHSKTDEGHESGEFTVRESYSDEVQS